MAKNKKAIILTGGAGFIGSCFLRKLNGEGIDNVVVVDDLGGDAKWKNLRGRRFMDYIHKDDFPGLLGSGRFGRVETIIHLGACSSTILTDAGYYLKNNYEYSCRLAEWAFAHGVKFIYASSAATYGSGERGYGDREEDLQDLRPLNIYGYSKHLFDLWLLRNNYFRKATGFKFFNVFGPNEYHKAEMMSLVCRNFKEAAAGRPLRLFRSYNPAYNDGEQKRDFVYVLDAVEVMYFFFLKQEKSGIFNLGTGRARSWNDLARAVFAAAGKPVNIEYVEMPEIIRSKYQYFTEAVTGKLRAAGCRHEFMELEDSVKDYAAYLDKEEYL